MLVALATSSRRGCSSSRSPLVRARRLAARRRTALPIFVFCALCSRPARTGRSTGSCSGCSGRESFRCARHRSSTPPSSVSQLRPESPSRALYLIPDGLPSRLPPGAASQLVAGVSTGCVAACTPAEFEGVLAHEVAHVRHPRRPGANGGVGHRGRVLESSRIGGWLERALLFVLVPSRRRSSICSSRRSASSRRIVSPRSSATPRTGSPTRSAPGAGSGAHRVRGEPCHRAAVHDQSVRGAWARGAVRHTPAGRGTRTPAARARSRLARPRSERSRRLNGRKRAALAAPFRK